MNEGFALANNPAPQRQRRFDAGDRPRQKVLFAGLDCLPGQMDLFATDGPRADEKQAANVRPDSTSAESGS